MEFKTADRIFQFETHCDRGQRHVSINVKVHPWGQKIPRSYEQKLKRLEELESGLAGKIKDWAWNDMCAAFWDWAKQRAEEELGLAPIFAEGRSGGHLILNAYTPDRVTDLCSAYESECTQCHRGWEHHARGQCVLQSTKWESVNSGCLIELESIETFFKEVAESLKGCPADYVYHLKYHIDERWDNRPSKKELAITNRVRAWSAGAPA